VINTVLDEVIIIEINENLADTYAEIDAFSQCRNPSYPDYPFVTPRNMGKNDLWRASTAALLGLKLVTTDADFSHLHQVFIEIQHIQPGSLIR
jgi:tRNA(fMet)-specific endonuclease VapC